MHTSIHDVVAINVGEAERQTRSEEAKRLGITENYWYRRIVIEDDEGRRFYFNLFSDEEGGLDFNKGA